MDMRHLIHFGIDGVIDVFKEIQKKNLNSIFEHPFFSAALSLYEKYNFSITLYVFEKNKDFRLEHLSERYWEEIKECFWMKFGWYGEAPDNTDDDGGEIRSFRRVCDLIKMKLDASRLDEVLYLHQRRMNNDLVRELLQENIKVLLISEEDIDDFEMSENEYICLKKNRISYGDIILKMRDINLESLYEADDTDYFLQETEQLFLNYIKEDLEVFCHESMFLKTFDKIDEYIKQLERRKILNNTRTGIFPNTGCVIEDKLFFSTHRDNNIYIMDIASRQYNKFVSLPIAPASYMKFAAMHSYLGKLVLVPCSEDCIWILDIESRDIKSIKLPIDFEEQRNSWKFRKSVQKDECIWIIPRNYPVLIEFNIESCKYEVYENWPAGITFAKNKSEINFMSMSLQGDWIYLFADKCSTSVKFNIYTHEMISWGAGIEKYYGVIHGEYLYSAPVITGQSQLLIQNADSGEIYKSLEAGVKRNKGGHSYSYWNPYFEDHMICFTPMLERKILIYDADKEVLLKIDPDNHNYQPMRKEYLEYMAYEILSGGEEMILIPFFNNSFVFFDKKNQTIESIQLSHSYRNHRFCIKSWELSQGNLVPEDEDIKLINLLEQKWNDKEDTELSAYNYGTQIHEMLVRSRNG